MTMTNSRRTFLASCAMAGTAAERPLAVSGQAVLGGKFRDRIRVYCDTALYQTRLPQPEPIVVRRA